MSSSSIRATSCISTVCDDARDPLNRLRLSLETACVQRQKNLRRETTKRHFQEAVFHLRQAGFSREEIGVYILCGLPGQDLEEVRESIDCVMDSGALPKLVEFSPLPATDEYARARRLCRIPIDNEPLLCNNSVFHRISSALPEGAVSDLRSYLRRRMEKT